MTSDRPYQRPPSHARRGPRQHRRQRHGRRDREVRVAGPRGPALLRVDGPRTPLLRGGPHHQPHLRHLLRRPHAGLAEGHRDRPGHRDQRAELEAPRASSSTPRTPTPTSCTSTSWWRRTCGSALGVPARRDHARRRRARAAPEAALPRVGSLIGGRTTHPTTRRAGRHGRPVPDRPRSWPQLKEKLVAAVPDLQATLETVKALAPQHPGLRPSHRVRRSGQRRELRPVRRQDLLDLPDGTQQRYPVADYKLVTNEFVVAQSTAKYAKNKTGQLRGRRPGAVQQQLRQARPRGQEGGRGPRPGSRSAPTRT